MSGIIAIIFGIVQGITEFLPISSSGHLLLLHELLPLQGLTDELSFDVALHVGTLCAVVLFFWKDIVRYTTALCRRPKEQEHRRDRMVAIGLLIAVVPAGIAGVLFESWIETVLRSPLIVASMLIGVGVLFILVEQVGKHHFTRSMDQLTWKHALLIGCAQVLALIPGTSRSGITIVTGMATGLQRDEAARFSFLVAIPLIAGAGLKKLLDLVIVGVATEEIPLLILGTLSSALVGYFAIRVLLQYLRRKTLTAFAVYRIILGGVVLLFFYLNFFN